MRLFTVAEASQILRVTPKSVRDFILSGQLKASKIGTWRISEDDLLEFIRSRSNVAPDRSLEDNEPGDIGTIRGQLNIDYYIDNPTPLVSETSEFINKSHFRDVTWQYTYDERLKRARFTASGEPAFLKAVLEILSKHTD